MKFVYLCWKIDAQETISLQIIPCSAIWLYLGVFRPAEQVFENYFGVPCDVKTQEMISAQIRVCRTNLDLEVFLTRW